jgi:tRNA-dihydrouridine synthase
MVGGMSLPAASLAPMEGVTVFPMRLWLHLASCPAAVTTPFLRVTKEAPARRELELFAPELHRLRGVLPYETTPQLMACEPANFLRAAERLLPVADAVELNCGCPTPNAAGRYAGSGILRDPDVFGATVERLATALGPRRLAIKMRVGHDAPEELEGLLRHVAAQPLARLTVHGRTRVERYLGRSRWELIETAARQAVAPTWASGDVVDFASLARLQAVAPSVAGVVVGRGALRNPWVFEELRGGSPQLDLACLVHALFAFALLNELWLKNPDKLLSRVETGRIGSPCATSADAWQGLAAGLAELVLGAPLALPPGRPLPPLAVSAPAMTRLRFLWSYLRDALPQPLQAAACLRAKRLDEFLGLIYLCGS